MKKPLKTLGLFVTAALFSVLVLYSCEKDETSLTGNPDLEVIPAEAIAGTYLVNDACYDFGSTTYTTLINPISGEDDGLAIYNFMNRGIIVFAYSSEGRFIIPVQDFKNSIVGARSDDSFSVRGELRVNSERELFISYEFLSGDNTTNCYANGKLENW